MRAEQDRDKRYEGQADPEPQPGRDMRTQSAKPVAVIFGILIVLIGMMLIIWQLAIRSVGS